MSYLETKSGLIFFFYCIHVSEVGVKTQETKWISPNTGDVKIPEVDDETSNAFMRSRRVETLYRG